MRMAMFRDFWRQDNVRSLACPIMRGNLRQTCNHPAVCLSARPNSVFTVSERGRARPLPGGLELSRLRVKSASRAANRSATSRVVNAPVRCAIGRGRGTCGLTKALNKYRKYLHICAASTIGHTLKEVLEQVTISTNLRPDLLGVNRGCRGHGVEATHVRTRGARRGVTSNQMWGSVTLEQMATLKTTAACPHCCLKGTIADAVFRLRPQHPQNPRPPPSWACLDDRRDVVRENAAKSPPSDRRCNERIAQRT
jgi:hypothetical protein